MSIYKGQWPERNEQIIVTVDGQPLQHAEAEVPGTGQTFGWGQFSPYTGKKLLAYSLLIHEMHHVMGLPRSTAHKYLLDMGDVFLDDQVAKLGRQWSLTSEEIGRWIKDKFPKIWDDLTSQHAHA